MRINSFSLLSDGLHPPPSCSFYEICSKSLGYIEPYHERKVGFGREKRPIEREKRASGAEFRACEVGFQIAKTLRFLAYFIGDTKGSESLFVLLNGGGFAAQPKTCWPAPTYSF